MIPLSRSTVCIACMLICMSSCYFPISNKKFAAKLGFTVKTAEYISFFNGKKEISTAPINPVTNYKIHLFYNGDTLKYVANEHWPYKFTKLNDSVIMLSRENMFKYRAADTLLFCKAICVTKSGDYDFFYDTAMKGQRLAPVHVDFSVYYFQNGDVYENREYFDGLNTEAELRPVYTYFEKMLSGKLVFTTGQFRGHFSDNQAAMLNFFRSYAH